MTATIVGIIISSLFGLASALISGLVFLNLRTIQSNQQRTEDRVDSIEREVKVIAQRKSQCQQDFVTAEQWVRSETYTRNKLDAVAESISAMNARFCVVEKLPEICGNVAAQVVEKMNQKRGGQA